MALHRVGSPGLGLLETISFSNIRTIQRLSLLFVALSAMLSAPQAIAGDGVAKIARSGGRITLSATLPSGTVGLPYSGQITVQGGTAPYKFALNDGSAPAGLFVNSKNGAVTGTPQAAGTTYFWVKASDAYGATTTKHMHISVLASTGSGSGSGSGISLAISPTNSTLASGASQQFNATVQGTGNTGVTWSASGGKISTNGMFTAPLVASNTNVNVTATSVADTTKNATASVAVTPAGTISVSVSPASAAVTSGGSQQFTATVQGTSNSAVTWSASAGTISTNGMFTAPQVSSATNVSVVATSAADSTKKASASVAVSPVSTSSTLAVSTSSLPGVQSGVAYAFTLVATGGTTPYKWNVVSGSLPQGLSLNGSGQLAGSTTQTGQFPFTVAVTDAASSTASKALSLSVISPPQPQPQSSNFDGPAELPRTYLQTAMANTPAPGSTVLVTSGASLQNALNSASCGDTIALAAGATFTGPFTFPAKSCDDQHWIIVRTSAPDTSLPPEGTRITPCYAGVASLPGRPAFHCAGSQNVMAQLVEPQSASGPIYFANGANHYRFIGLEITRTPGIGIVYDLVSVPTGTADKVYFDRVWLHGSTNDETKAGLALGGVTNAALIDSYSSDFHCTSMVGTCTDAQVVGGGNGSSSGGPFKIANNFLEASGEAILFGGGGSSVTPTDIEIRRNHFYKPLIWMKGQPGFVGGSSGYPFMVKNALELKNAQRVLIEGNVFEYSWGGFSQVGFLILLTPKNQGGQCPICQVTDVTIRYNTLSHSGTGISIANGTSDTGASGTAGERYSIHDITIDDINMSLYNGGGAAFQIINAWPVTPLNSVSINHVTAFPDPASKIISLGNDSTNQTMYGFTFTNNMIGTARFPIYSSGGPLNCAISSVPLTALNACFPQGYTFQNNALIAVNGNYPPSTWPANNLFASSVSAVQFANFNNGIGGDYTLLSSSPYKNAGTDGKDLGADISAIQSAIVGVY